MKKQTTFRLTAQSDESRSEPQQIVIDTCSELLTAIKARITPGKRCRVDMLGIAEDEMGSGWYTRSTRDDVLLEMLTELGTVHGLCRAINRQYRRAIAKETENRGGKVVRRRIGFVAGLLYFWLCGMPQYGMVRAWWIAHLSFALPTLFERIHGRVPTDSELERLCRRAHWYVGQIKRMPTQDELVRLVGELWA